MMLRIVVLAITCHFFLCAQSASQQAFQPFAKLFIPNATGNSVSVLRVSTSGHPQLDDVVAVGGTPELVLAVKELDSVFIAFAGSASPSTPPGISLLDIRSHARVTDFDVEGRVGGMDFNPGSMGVGTCPGPLLWITESNSIRRIVGLYPNTGIVACAPDFTLPPGSEQSLRGIVVTSSGKVYFADEEFGVVYVFDGHQLHEIIELPQNNRLGQMLLHPTERKVYALNNAPLDGNILVIDTSTDEITQDRLLELSVDDLAMASLGDALLVTNRITNSLTVVPVDRVTGELQGPHQTIRVGEGPLGVSVSEPFGGVAFVANAQDNTLSVVDVTAGMATVTVEGFSFPISIGRFYTQVPPPDVPTLSGDGLVFIFVIFLATGIAVLRTRRRHSPT